MLAGVAVLVGPEGEGKNSEIIDERDSVAVFCEVNGADVELAGVARFDAHMRELLGDIDGELVFRFFAAGRTKQAAKIPFAHTKRAEEEALATVAFDPESADHGQGTATRADAGRGARLRHGQAGGERLRVGLQKGAQDEFDEQLGGFFIAWRVDVVWEPAGRPEVGEEGNPGGGALQRELAGGFRGRRGRNTFQ